MNPEEPNTPEEKTAIIRLPPTTMARKRAYLRAADGQPLAEWIFEVCDKASEADKPKPE